MKSRLLSSAFLLASACVCASFARADVSVDASKIVRARPIGIGGTVIEAHDPRFATGADGINYIEDLKRAKVGLVRSFSYPDQRHPEHDLAYFDRNIAAIQQAGATPLLIENIKPGLAYLKEDGTPGGTVASNAVFLVKHYTSAPFNISKISMEVSNEPNQGIDYQVKTPQEYADNFNAIHDALSKAGLREKVVLCGPVISYPYKWTGLTFKDDIMDTFLDKCRDSVDIVTFHNYVGGGMDGVMNAPHKLDYMDDSSRQFATNPKDGKLKDFYGVAALMAQMDKIHFGRPNVGVGLTEHNVNSNRNRVVRGLWNLAVTHYYLYNPRGLMDTSFVFDHYGGQQGGLGHYDDKKHPDFSYWALWIRGNLTGDQVLQQIVTPNANKSNTMKDGRSLLIVTATKTANTVYVEVINRALSTVKDHVVLSGARGAKSPLIHVLGEYNLPEALGAATTPKVEVPADAPQVFAQGKNAPPPVSAIFPDKATPSTLGLGFDYSFPPMSATIFEFPLGK